MTDTVKRLMIIAAISHQALEAELTRLLTPLSDEQIEEIWKAHVLPGFTDRQRFYSPTVFAREVEQAHGITGCAE